MPTPILQPHHRAGLDNLIAWLEPQPEYLALVIGGSLAKGFGDKYCDLDVIFVITEEDFARRQKTGDLILYSEKFTDYPGGYVDGKMMSPSFLNAVAERGSEPARSAFTNSWIEWSRKGNDELSDLVARIPVYPEAEREDKLRRFAAEMEAMKWFAGEAARKQSRYLFARTAARTALFAARLLLAHNRILYPYHKWVLRELANAPEKPDGIIERIDHMLDVQTIEAIHAVADAVLNFREWPQFEENWGARFLLENEWNWLHHPPPLEDC